MSLNNKQPIPLTAERFSIGTMILARPKPLLEIDLLASFKSVRIEISSLHEHFWCHKYSEVINQFKQ